MRPYLLMMDRRAFLTGAAAMPFVLGSSSARAGLLGGTPLALVTADLESHVVAVEPASGWVVGRVRTERGPRSIENVDARTALIAHTSTGVVSLLDGASLRVRALLRGFAEPRYTAADPLGRFAYVTDSGRGDVAVVDVLRDEVVERVRLGGPARHVSLSSSGRQLWVALGSKAQEVAVLAVSERGRPRLVARLRPPFLTHDVGFAPDGRSVWVTSGDRGLIAVYDSRRRRIRFTVAAGTPPQHVTFIGERAYVASGDDGTLRVHDLENGRVLRATRIPLGSYNVQQGWGMVMTPSLKRGTVCLLERSGRLVHQLRVARSSHDACFVMRG
jgi:DNA-binding beta-propeller fold protein YncE